MTARRRPRSILTAFYVVVTLGIMVGGSLWLDYRSDTVLATVSGKTEEIQFSYVPQGAWYRFYRVGVTFTTADGRPGMATIGAPQERFDALNPSGTFVTSVSSRCSPAAVAKPSPAARPDVPVLSAHPAKAHASVTDERKPEPMPLHISAPRGTSNSAAVALLEELLPRRLRVIGNDPISIIDLSVRAGTAPRGSRWVIEDDPCPAFRSTVPCDS